MQTSHSSDAVRFFHQSIECEKNGDFMQAYQLLIGALSEDRNIPGVWHNLGVVLGKLKHFPAAAGAFYKSVQMVPDSPLCLSNYAWMLHLAGRSEQALPLIKNVIEKEPDKPNHWTNLSQIELALDHYEEALKAGARAVEIASGDIMARLALSLALLRTGDYQNGLREYEARFPYVLPQVLKYPYPAWRGEDISKQRLFIPCEQGIGDSVMFMRFIPEAAARARKVICYVHDNSLKLYRRNLPSNVELHPIPRELPPAEVFCPLLSLPVAMGLTNEQINNSFYEYKYAPIESHKKDFPKGVLKIGICWAGDPNHDNDMYRSSNLKDFLRLAELPNVQLYSFQVGPRAVDLDTCGAHSIVRNMTPHLLNTNTTCALLAEHMDLVVTIDTAFAHMAASMGVKTYMLLGKQGVDWRWFDGQGVSTWYPSLTMMRQDRNGDWAGLIERVMMKITADSAVHP